MVTVLYKIPLIFLINYIYCIILFSITIIIKTLSILLLNVCMYIIIICKKK